MASADQSNHGQMQELPTGNDIAQYFQSFTSSVADNFKHGAERLFGIFGGNFVQQLQEHIREMDSISHEIEKENSDFAERLQNLKKDFSSLQDDYHAIYTSTKGVVEYGCSNIIPNILGLIANDEYCEAINTIEVFLRILKERLEEVKNNIDEIWQGRCVDVSDEIKDQIKRMRQENNDAQNKFLKKAKQEQERKIELLKLGCTTFLCVNVAGRMAARFVSPDTDIGIELMQAAEQVGKEFISFGAANLCKGIHYIVSSDLSVKVNSSASKLHRSFNTFLGGVTDFQADIETVINGINRVKVYTKKLEEKMEQNPANPTNKAEQKAIWVNISIYLKQIHDSVRYLKDKVIDKNGYKIDEISKTVDTLST